MAEEPSKKEALEALQRIMAHLNTDGWTMQCQSKPESEDQRTERMVNRYNATTGDLADGYHCEICNDRGKIAYNSNGYFRIKPCSCMGARVSLAHLRESGLYDMVQTMRFDTFHTDNGWQEKAKQTAQAWAEKPSGWLFFCGTPGCGKTHLCTAAARELMLRGVTLRYALWREVAQKIKAASLDAEARDAIIGPMEACDCLYLDDFLKVGSNEKPTAADISIAYEILNHRYISAKPTIISTERTISEIMALDEAVGSRI